MPAELVSRYTTLIARMAAQDARVEIKKLQQSYGQDEFKVKHLWEAKASREYRMFFDRVQYPRTILGFMHRSNKRVFNSER